MNNKTLKATAWALAMAGLSFTSCSDDMGTESGGSSSTLTHPYVIAATVTGSNATANILTSAPHTGRRDHTIRTGQRRRHLLGVL